MLTQEFYLAWEKARLQDAGYDGLIESLESHLAEARIARAREQMYARITPGDLQTRVKQGLLNGRAE